MPQDVERFQGVSELIDALILSSSVLRVPLHINTWHKVVAGWLRIVSEIVRNPNLMLIKSLTNFLSSVDLTLTTQMAESTVSKRFYCSAVQMCRTHALRVTTGNTVSLPKTDSGASLRAGAASPQFIMIASVESEQSFLALCGTTAYDPHGKCLKPRLH